MYKLLKPLFFSLDPERAHALALRLMDFPGAKWLFKKLYFVENKKFEKTVFGLTFPNPVGLAAGFDKDGVYVDKMHRLGFGFIEVGTTTPMPQLGNPKPRLFRLVPDRALINRMGFNNMGVDVLAVRLAKRPAGIIVGGNIGKNKVTPNEDAVKDYLICFEKLFDVVDYFVVNVSSPNTPGLRELQERGPLTELLNALQAANQKKKNPKPILLKIAPDLTDSQLDDILEIVKETQLAGIVATNTTIAREGLTTPKATVEAIGAGGLSGAPLRKRSLEVVKYLHSKSQGTIPIIGVGGIAKPEDAQAMLDAGASLVQVYSGFIYEGPGMVKRILGGILK